MFNKCIVILGLVAIITVALAVVARNWKPEKKPKPIPEQSYEVAGIPNGAAIEIKSGLLGKQTYRIVLAGIAVPVDTHPLAEESRKNLEKLAGQIVRVDAVKKQSWHLLNTDKSLVSVEVQKPPASAVVYGEGGECLQTAQLRAGLARIEGERDADSEWKEAEKEARKARIGIWAK